jgi:hypothetical protein
MYIKKYFFKGSKTPCTQMTGLSVTFFERGTLYQYMYMYAHNVQ